MIIIPLSLYFSVSWKSNSWRIAIVLVWVRAKVWNISSSSSSTRFFYFVYFYTTYDWLEIVPKRTFAYSYSSYLGVISFYNYCNFWSISFNLFFKCISYYCSRGGLYMYYLRVYIMQLELSRADFLSIFLCVINIPPFLKIHLFINIKYLY